MNRMGVKDVQLDPAEFYPFFMEYPPLFSIYLYIATTIQMVAEQPASLPIKPINLWKEKKS